MGCVPTADLLFLTPTRPIMTQNSPDDLGGCTNTVQATQRILRRHHRTLARRSPGASRRRLPPTALTFQHARAHDRLRHAACGQPGVRRLRRHDARRKRDPRQQQEGSDRDRARAANGLRAPLGRVAHTRRFGRLGRVSGTGRYVLTL